VLYCNDGDWVESLSALVEWQDGRLEVIHWREQAHSTVSSVQVLAA
jgi:UDP-2,3-diacylglucosamine pyrophosphatase LpxH